MKVYAWLIDLIQISEKLPHGDDFRVGPKSDSTQRDNTVFRLDEILLHSNRIVFDRAVEKIILSCQRDPRAAPSNPTLHGMPA